MKRKIFSILFALVLVCSFGLVTAAPAGAVGPDEVWVDLNFARDIDGVLSPGEWGTPLCTETGTYETVTVYAHATMDALYLAFDTGDVTDNRGGAGLDVLDWNIGLVGSDFSNLNPDWCPPSGPPWRYALRTKVQVDNSWGDSWDAIDGYHGCWEDTWNPNVADPLTSYYHIPGGIEMVSSFGTGHRVTEFKIPMSLMFDGTHGWNGPSGGETLLLGGTFSGEDAGANFEMLWWPTGINHCTEGTYATIEVEGRPSTPLGGHTFGFDAFVTIQGGINAVAGSIVNVAPGTYDEVVAVNESVNLLGANAGECAGVAPGTRGPETIIDGRIDIQASNVVIDGIKLINGFDLLGEHAGIYMIDQSHITITNSIFVGPVSPAKPANAMILGHYGGSAETHSENISVTCCESYNWNMGAYANPGGGFSTDYLFQYNNFHDNSHCGLGLDVIGVSVLNNNFTNNSIGIEAFRDNTVVHWNNFCGNGVGIDFNTTTYGATFLDATNNYWCHPSGPSHSPGYGDPVSGNVLYDPWLLEPVVPGEPLPTTFDKTLALNIGWTLVSTDNWIDAANTVGVGVILAINYTPSDGWFEVTPAALVPVNALYLKMEEGGGLGITYSGGVPIASSKDLEAGWNLISSATIDNAKNILSPLRYIDVGEEQGVGLATLVSQGPPLNHNSPSFYQSTVVMGDWFTLGGITLNPFDGYWVYMNAGKGFGVVPGH